MAFALRWVGFMAAVLCASPGMAQSVSDADSTRVEPERVAILILAARGVDAELADSLTELLIGVAATRGNLFIVGKEEFQARLGQDEGRSLECIGSAACLGRVGVELEVDQVVAGTVGRSRRGWVYNLNRIDIRSGDLVGRAFREVSGDLGELAASLQASFPELYDELERRATLEVFADVPGAEVRVDGVDAGTIGTRPMRLRELTAGEHEVEIHAPGHEPWIRQVELASGQLLRLDVSLAVRIAEDISEGRGVSSWMWVGLGVAVASAASASIFGARSQAEPTEGITRGAAVEEVEARRSDATMAHVSLGVMGAGVVLSVIGLALSDFSATEPEPANVARFQYGVTAGPSGASVTLRGAL